MSSAPVAVSVRQVGERRVHLLEAGAPGNPEIVLIHGGMGDAALHWQKTLPTLGTSFHVYAPDLPGFHDDSDALTKPSISHMMQWINALLGDLGVEKFFLVGTSIGALLTRFYAAHYPADVERLVLVDGGEIANLPGIVRAIINAPGISQAFYGDRYRRIYSRAGLERSIYRHDLLTEDFFQVLQRASEGFMPLLRACLAEPWPAARTPQCPTLIVWGQDDRLVPPDVGKKLLSEIPQAELTLIEHAGHMPMLEQPDAFTAAVKQFLSN
jgi:pimeloyl-ACP methyl ester carboxylesterase